MSFTVAPIVEGHGDVAALPLLLRRMAPSLDVKRPVRCPKTRLLIPEHLRRAATIAAANILGRGAILLVFDANGDCAAELGPKLEAHLREMVPNRPCRAALAVREFEAWIVGGDAAYGAGDADTAGDLKGRIRRRHGVYSETADQPRLVARSDLALLEERSRSFRRLAKVVREFEEIAARP